MPRDTPYSGVAAIFRSCLENGVAPRVFEDGGQRRDFVHVRDVARANLLALGALGGLPEGSLRCYNVASGEPHTVGEMAFALAAAFGTAGSASGAAASASGAAGSGLGAAGDGFGAAGSGGVIEPVVTGEFRLGDVRHIVASPEGAAHDLGFRAQIRFAEGMAEFASAPLREPVLAQA